MQVLVTATGRKPVVAGKPEPPLHAESVQRVGARRPLVVGDRLDTDIEGAVRGGADSLLVLTGVTQPADVLLAPPQRRPTYIAADLGGLNSAIPRSRSGRRVQLRRLDGVGDAGRRGWLAVSGSGDWIDGLRALCAAAWSAGPPPAR